MPLYVFACSCGFSDEYLVSVEKRDAVAFACDRCGKRLVRQVTAPVLGKSRYQMQAVLSSGEHVPGHFGKAAKKK